MNLFIDASALVAMLAKGSDALDLADRLDQPHALLWSTVVQSKSVAALTRKRSFDPDDARADVSKFGQQWRLKLVTIGEREGDLAFEAFRRYGEGTGHPARLSMADCFAYACARGNDARLLYKGNDFAQTDLA